MKKLKLFTIFAAALMLGTLSFAEINFSGMAGGSTGIAGDTSKEDGFTIPFNAFAAAQLNFGSWGIFRANLGLASDNLAKGNILTGQDATLTMNELSLVLIKNSGKVKNYFGFYIGTYEVVGTDEYLQRQFGIEPFTSLATRNSTTLSTGITLYNNYGAGFSYTMNFADVPGTFGFNLYFNTTEHNIPKLNFDLRTAWTTPIFTVDLSGGIGAPLQNNHSGSSVILLIDTIYAHGGMSLLLGSPYTHSIFVQAGIQNIELSKGSIEESFNGLKDFSLLVEPRIYTKAVKLRITAYNLPEDTVKNMFYLNDSLGAVLSVYSDTVPVKNNNMSLGCHFIGSLKETDFITLASGNIDPETLKIDAYITPFIDLPVASGNLEIMAQLGAEELINNLHFTYQAKVGYKKAF